MTMSDIRTSNCFSPLRAQGQKEMTVAYDTLVSAGILQQQLNHPDWVILDARFNLSDTEAGRQAYQQGHIPGAYYVHLDEQLSSPITAESGRHPLPDPQTLADWLGSVGIGADTQVVIYDDMGGAMAGRCWWLLKTLGHQAAAVLDGGLSHWQEQGFAVTFDTTAAAIPCAFQMQWQSGAVIDMQRVLVNLDKATFQLVDARAPERYRGEQEPIDPVAGHIPRALNRALNLNLGADGCFKSPQQLQQEWQALLADQGPETIVHMCGSGVTACHNHLAMEYAGLTGSRVYAGSWSEWIRGSKRPVATSSDSLSR
ncbi:MAG: sulfurtransferase [Motiliproteus sp.]